MASMELSVLEPVFRLPMANEDLSIEILNLTAVPSVSPGDLLQLGTEIFSTAQSLDQYLSGMDQMNYLIRVISLAKENSYAPLDVGRDMLEAVMAAHNIMPAFQQVIFSFRPQTNRLEEGYLECLWKQQKNDILEIAHVIKYPELRSNSGDNTEWSIRQIGIYQQYDISIKRSTWMLIFPNRKSTTRRDLVSRLHPQGECHAILDHPLSVHAFLFLARLDNWRLYINHFENEVWKLGNLTLTIDIGDALSFQEMYTDLSTLHYLESRLAPLCSIFRAKRRLAGELGRINDQLEKEGHVAKDKALELRELLGNLTSRIQAYDDNVEFVLSKIRRTTQLVSDTISLKSQHTSEEMSNRIFDLTKVTVEDSTSMRVTTFTTLVFLPSTFVGGLFGMGFFAVKDDSGVRWIMSPLVWVFFAIAIPLTFVTLWFWRWSMMRANQSRDREGLGDTSV